MLGWLEWVITLLSLVFVWLLYDGGYFDAAYEWFFALLPTRHPIPYPHDRTDHPGSPEGGGGGGLRRRGRLARDGGRQMGSPNVGRGWRSNDIVEQLDSNAERHMQIERILQTREKKTLVLDLDETLVHSSVEPDSRAYDFTVQVPIREDAMPRTFYVFKRPYVDHFLRCVEEWYDVVIFTASLSSYANPVVDRLDKNGKLKRRHFREDCKFRSPNHYIKDLLSVGFDVTKTIIIDNSADAFAHDVNNAIQIGHYYPSNENDEDLLSMLPILYCLRAVVDVRSVLSLHNLLQL